MNNAYQVLEERISEWGTSNDETSFAFQTVKGEPEKLVLFDPGAEVDFVFRHTSDLDHIAKYKYTFPGDLFSHIQTWLEEQYDKHR
ncbi:hypothetical protein AV545_19185 [Paenibacillus jamilae]|uniref:hypothetical protein n=1 Tax=Paenibacillus jamilae TaxID=114136 RepID=UPI0007ABBC2C|nr:hypothetical protein [Paenibacillus jamilae]KZE71142.1 hypothetical protein AV545_19185 [Paenibacillus jamilae]